MITKNIKIALSCSFVLILVIACADFIPHNKKAVAPIENTQADNAKVITYSYDDIESELIQDKATYMLEATTIKNEVDVAKKSDTLKANMVQVSAEIISAREKKNALQLAQVSRGGGGSGFDNYNVTTPSNLTGEQIDKAIAGTGLAGLGSAFADAEKAEGVNALFLVGIAITESGWGTSHYATTRNNLFGYQAYTNNPDAAARFASKRDCIMTVAHALKTNYLTRGGRYFNGFTTRDVNKRYAADPNWGAKVANNMNLLTQRLN